MRGSQALQQRSRVFDWVKDGIENLHIAQEHHTATAMVWRTGSGFSVAAFPPGLSLLLQGTAAVLLSHDTLHDA